MRRYKATTPNGMIDDGNDQQQTITTTIKIKYTHNDLTNKMYRFVSYKTTNIEMIIEFSSNLISVPFASLPSRLLWTKLED